MRTSIVLRVLMLLGFFLGGCAADRSVAVDPHFWQQQGKRVGIVLVTFPHARTTEVVTPVFIFSNVNPLAPGGPLFNNEMDYEPLRLNDMKPLKKASSEVDAQEFSRVQDLLVEGLKDRGFAAFKTERMVSSKELLTFNDSKGYLHEPRDLRELLRSQEADYLVIVELHDFGPYCHWIHAYNDRMAVVAYVRAEMRDVKTNKILWRAEYQYHKPVEASCSNQDQIPLITNAVQDLLSDAAVSVSKHFFASQKLRSRNLPDSRALSRARP